MNESTLCECGCGSPANCPSCGYQIHTEHARGCETPAFWPPRKSHPEPHDQFEAFGPVFP